jgi:hypothetical protein
MRTASPRTFQKGRPSLTSYAVLRARTRAFIPPDAAQSAPIAPKPRSVTLLCSPSCRMRPPTMSVTAPGATVESCSTSRSASEGAMMTLASATTNRRNGNIARMP